MVVEMSQGASGTTKAERPYGLALALGIVLSLLVVADIAAFALEGERLRGTDYLILAIYLGFLTVCVLRRRVASKLAISLLVATAAVLAVEATSSVVRAGSSRAFDWYVSPPGYACLLLPQDLIGVSKEGSYTTNSFGLRGSEYPEEPHYRILCVGGSTTECHYLDDALTWPALLERRLTESGERVWVGNAGTSGSILAHHITLLENLPEADEADCWVVLSGINDAGQVLRGTYDETVAKAWETSFRYRRPGLRLDLDRPFHRNFNTYWALERLRKRAKVAMNGHDWLVFQDHRAFWISKRRKARAAAEKTNELPDLTAARAEYSRLLQRLIELSRERGKQLVLLTQPTLYQTDLPAELEAQTYGGQLKDGTFLTIGALVRPIDVFNLAMIQISSRAGIPCVDLATTLPKSTEVFYDECHFNESGARLVAEAVARTIAELDLAPVAR